MMRSRILVGKLVTLASIDKWATPKYGQMSVDVIYDQDEVNSILDHLLGDARHKFSETTAVAVIVGDGDYLHVWLSESSRPYENSALYQHVRVQLY